MDNTQENIPQIQSRTILKYKIHWHVIFTHLPISLFMVSAGFMFFHLFIRSACFELTAYICLVAGSILILPTALTGWLTWKKRYKGARTRIFLYKLRIAYFIILLSWTLVLWRTLFPDTTHDIWHNIYSIGIFLLFLGVTLEGFYGGRLNHR